MEVSGFGGVTNLKKGSKGMNSVFVILRFLILILLLSGCSGNNKEQQADESLSSGTIHISVDETFKPVIDSQISVFIASYPNAKIITHYKPEAECLKDLKNDSIRMVIVTRGLSEEEVNLFRDTLGYAPRFGKIASDAIAVVVNNSAKDSMFAVSDIRGMLNGTSGYHYKLVMDGNKATSTVRFMIDSVLKDGQLAANVQAAATSEGVIDYVSRNADAIGFVGVSWIGNKEDSLQLSFLDKVRIANIQCRGCENEVYVKPYQANIVLKRYPLVRGLYYILKENYAGLGSGFSNFLTGERGQLIFKRAYLAPSRMALQVRKVDMEETSF
jgi:phosphate transport system substrate-binding protein